MGGGGSKSAAVATAEPAGDRLSLVARFAVYGLLGWGIEVLFTSLVDAATGAGDVRLRGYSYVWMHPVWGVGLLLGEKLSQCFQRAGLGRATRAVLGMAVCFAVEYSAGALLVALIGRCPWDYSASVWNVNGLIRLDYAPFWWMCCLVYEPLGSLMRRVRIAAPEPVPEPAPEPQASPQLWPSRGVSVTSLSQ
jgi:uncharacterized membrane protein